MQIWDYINQQRASKVCIRKYIDYNMIKIKTDVNSSEQWKTKVRNQNLPMREYHFFKSGGSQPSS